MKNFRTKIWIHVVSIVLVLLAKQIFARDMVRLWYDEPASKWTNALPLGNGWLGAMVFGTVTKERLQLSEESLWAGEPTDVYPEQVSDAMEQLGLKLKHGRIRASDVFRLCSEIAAELDSRAGSCRGRKMCDVSKNVIDRNCDILVWS